MPTPSSQNGPARAAAIPAFPQDLAPDSVPLLSIFGASARIDGKFDIADSLEVDCQVSGELTVSNRLVVGPHATVTADVKTVDIVVMGRYDGHLVATGSVEIMAGGRVTGHIETDALIIETGSVFEATVSRLEHREIGLTPAPLYRLNPKGAELRASRSP